MNPAGDAHAGGAASAGAAAGVRGGGSEDETDYAE